MTVAAIVGITLLASTAAGTISQPDTPPQSPTPFAASANQATPRALATFPYRSITLKDRPAPANSYLIKVSTGGRHPTVRSHAMRKSGRLVTTEIRRKPSCSSINGGTLCEGAWEVTPSEVLYGATWKPRGATQTASCVLLGLRGKAGTELHCDGSSITL